MRHIIGTNALSLSNELVLTGTWTSKNADEPLKKIRTCALNRQARVGPNWRLRVRFVVEVGQMRVLTEQDSTYMHVEFEPDEM